jgi:hypothetical protein
MNCNILNFAFLRNVTLVKNVKIYQQKFSDLLLTAEILGTLKNAVFWDVTPCGSGKNRISEEPIASIIWVS